MYQNIVSAKSIKLNLYDSLLDALGFGVELDTEEGGNRYRHFIYGCCVLYGSAHEHDMCHEMCFMVLA